MNRQTHRGKMPGALTHGLFIRVGLVGLKVRRTDLTDLTVLTVLTLLLAVSAQAANYPPQILIPRAVGTSVDPGGAAISANHRIFWAYPGVVYNIRAAVIGGAFPFTYALQNAPAGMTIDSFSGEINWPNPQADAANITLRVMDAEGTVVQTSWSIDVDASRFLFLNASAPEGGNGSFASPFNSLSDIPNNTFAGRIAYFMTGTYNVLDMPRSGGPGGWERVEFPNTKPQTWLEYPGHAAVIDFGWAGGAEFGPLIRGPNYMEGFETRRSHLIGFQPTGDYIVIRRMNMHTHGPGQDGSNSAFLMFMSNYGAPRFGTVIQDNVFSNLVNASGTCAIKLYSMQKPLLEDNVVHTADAGGEALFAIKSDIERFTVRRNTFYNIGQPAIGGNMHGIPAGGDRPVDVPNVHGEILFNNVRASSFPEAIHVNHDGQALRVDVYRNTFNGRVELRSTDSADGPFNFYNNVIVTNDPLGSCTAASRIRCVNVTAPSRVQIVNNLEGTPSQGIIDANGDLTTAYLSYLGQRGHQLGAGGPTPPAPPPPPPPPVPVQSLFEIPHHLAPYRLYWNDRANSAALTAHGIFGPKAPGTLWNYEHRSSGGWNNGPFARYSWWDWDISGVGHAGSEAGWFSPAGSLFRPSGGWPAGPYYLRFRIRINLPLLPHAPNGLCDDTQMKFFIWNSFTADGTDRAIMMLHAGSQGGGNDTSQTTLDLRAGVSGSYARTLIPNGQWVNVQLAFRGGPEGTGFQRIYINTNAIGSPTAENLQFNDLPSQTWGFGTQAGLDNQLFWGGISNTGSCVREDAEIDIMDMQVDDQFDPNWHATGTPPPPPPSGSRCDVDASGSTTVVDVQLCVNQAIGILGCTTGDIDLNGSCNVVDVQRVVNAALGGVCVVTP